MHIHTASNTILTDLSAVCRWLVRNHNIARPEDAADLSELMTEHGISDYAPAAHIPTQAEIIVALTAALEAHYDAKATERRYDNRLTCALRAGYAGPFQAEGTAFAIWMDTCNATAYQIMCDCMAGTRQIPTAEDLVAAMPLLVWP